MNHVDITFTLLPITIKSRSNSVNFDACHAFTLSVGKVLYHHVSILYVGSVSDIIGHIAIYCIGPGVLP